MPTGPYTRCALLTTNHDPRITRALPTLVSPDSRTLKGFFDNGSTDTIFNTTSVFTHLEALPEPLIFDTTSGDSVIHATHRGYAKVLVLNTHDGQPRQWETPAVYSPDSDYNLFTLGNGGFATRIAGLDARNRSIIHVVTHDYNTRRDVPDLVLYGDPTEKLLQLVFAPVIDAPICTTAATFFSRHKPGSRSQPRIHRLVQQRFLNPPADIWALMLTRAEETNLLPNSLPATIDPARAIANMHEAPHPLRESRPLILSQAAAAFTRSRGTLDVDLFGPNQIDLDPFNDSMEVRFALVAYLENVNFLRVYPLAAKSDAVMAIDTFLHQYGGVETLHSDNGGEFVNERMGTVLRRHGVRFHTKTVPGHSHQNPAERQNRRVIEMARLVAASTNISPAKWALNLQIAAALLNMMPLGTKCKAARSFPELAPYSPYELLSGRTASLSLLRMVGTQAYVRIHGTVLQGDEGGTRFSDRATRMVYVGPAQPHTGERAGMFLSLELGRVVTAVTYLVDESDFPVVDADSCDTGREMTAHRLLPLPSSPRLPVARAPTTSRGHADGGGGLDLQPLQPPLQPEGPQTQTELLADLLPNAEAPVPPASTEQMELDQQSLNEQPAQQAQLPPTSSLLWPLHQREVAELDDEFTPEKVSGEEVTCDESDRVLRPRASLKAPERLLNPRTYLSRQNVGKSSFPCFTSLLTLAALTTSAITPGILGVNDGPVAWSTPQSTDDIFQMKIPDWQEWMTAFNVEMDALKDLGAVTLATSADIANAQVLRGKYIFTIKDMGTAAQRRKVRLVLKGFLQAPMALEDLYAPTAHWETILIILALYAINKVSGTANLGLYKVDVVSAFLHGELNSAQKYIMYAPDSTGKTVAWLVLHGIPGMKQAGNCWNQKLHECMLNAGLKQCAADPCLYFNGSSTSETRVLSGWHVDDGLVMHNLTAAALKIFNGKLGELIKGKIKPSPAFDNRLMLGFNMRETEHGLIIYAEHYIEEAFGDRSYLPEDERKADAPEAPASPDLLAAIVNDSTQHLNEDDKREFQVLLGKARWVCKVRKDIEYPMAVLSACAAKPTQLAYRRLCYLVRYLKNTPQLGLSFDGRQSMMEGYADADHNVRPDGRSYTGVVIRMAGCPIVGFTRKQTIATTSTACAEILALSALVQKMSEIKAILDSIDLSPKLPIALYCDNNAAVLASKTFTSRKTRHLGNHLAFIRDQVIRLKTMVVHQVSSKTNLADVFTKVLPVGAFLDVREILMDAKAHTPEIVAEALR